MSATSTDRLSLDIRQALDQGREGFALVNQQGQFAYTNRAHSLMYGYEPDELLGKPWQILYSPENADLISNRHFTQVHEHGRWQGLLNGVHQDGSEVIADITLTALTNELGEYDGLICNCRSTRERTLADAAVYRLQKADALGQLTRGVAHDFNNLLSVIMGNLDLSLTQPLPDSVAQQLELAYQASQRGAELISQLQAYSGTQRTKPEAIDLGLLFDEIRQQFDANATHGIQLVCHAQADLRPCYTDRGFLLNAIDNLLTNAVHALDGPNRPTKRSPKIELRAYATEPAATADTVHILVEDNGCGMSDEVLDRAFDPFFSTKPVNENSGLGLSIVQGFVKQSNGSIKASSHQDRGTQVDFSLPCAATTTVAQQATTGLSRKTQRILVIEDDEHVRETTAQTLQHLNYQVMQAADGQQALQQLHQVANIDLVLSDVRLPGSLQGNHIVQQVRQKYPHIRCLLMSGHASQPDCYDGYGNLIPFLAKPYSMDELAAALANWPNQGRMAVQSTPPQ